MQDENDGSLFAAVADIEKYRYLKLRGLSDRALLISYCASDFIDVLMANGMFQKYYAFV